MDPALRIALTVGAAVFLRAFISARWEAYKAREAGRPVPMKLRNGVYVPNGRVARIERLFDRVFVAWLFYVGVLLVAVVVVKF